MPLVNGINLFQSAEQVHRVLLCRSPPLLTHYTTVSSTGVSYPRRTHGLSHLCALTHTHRLSHLCASHTPHLQAQLKPSRCSALSEVLALSTCNVPDSSQDDYFGCEHLEPGTGCVCLTYVSSVPKAGAQLWVTLSSAFPLL